MTPHEAVNAPLFQGIPPAVVASLFAAGTRRSLADREVLLVPGSPNHSLFVLLRGTLEIRPVGGAPTGTIDVGPGECVGELSIIDGKPTSAQVMAAGASEVLIIPEERVWAELICLPAFARNLLQILTRRLRRAAYGQAAYEQLRKELHVAREIQSSMVPRGDLMFNEHPQITCAAVMDPAAEVGGDFFDAFFLDDRHLFLAVGDVAGKGIGAALYMARSLTMLRHEAVRRQPVREVLARVNALLANGNESAHFLALVAAVLDVNSGELRFANGGLGTPLVRRGGQWEPLAMPRGLVLGIYPDFEYGQGRTRLAVGDALALFTDGVTDAAPADGEPFGQERLATSLAAAAGTSAQAAVTAVRESVRSYVGEAPPFDDFTLMVVERRSPVP